jgi:dienelactone hydrolase
MNNRTTAAISVRLLALFIPLLSLLTLDTAWAEVKTKTVGYRDGDVELQGFLAWDDAVKGKRPGVIVVHEWWGLNDYAKKRAEMLAKLGYVAFAIDMYGKGKVTDHPDQASAWMKQIADNAAAAQKRALLGLDILRRNALVDPTRIAAIGYCFGGATVMQMAYAGADLAGVVSFHGSLPVATDEQGRQIKAKILVAHGSADSFVPRERVAEFQQALDKAGADWQMITYGGARHGFTNPGADKYGVENIRYNKNADIRSWQEMRQFFADIFHTGR